MTINLIYYIWLGVFGVFVLIQLFQWGYRLITQNRTVKLTKITDYELKKDKINPGLNKVIFIFSQVLVVASLGFIIYFQTLDFEVYKYYFFMLIPIAISDGSIIFYELTKTRYHFDLEKVDTAYYRIEGIKSNVDRYIQERNQLINKLSVFISQTNQLLENLLKGSSSSIFQSVMEDLSKNQTVIENKILNLNENITKIENSFIEELINYLKNKEADFKHFFKEHSVDDVEHDSETEYKNIVKHTHIKIQEAIHSFCSVNAHISLEETQHIFMILDSYEDKIDRDLVILLLEKASIESTEYSEFNRFFYKANIDFKEVFDSYIVPNDKSWFFDRHLMSIQDKSIIRYIFKSVLTQNADKSLHRLIRTLDAKVISDIEDLSQVIEIEPNVRKTIEVYSRITRKLYRSINPMNETENLLIILKSLKDPLPETVDTLNQIKNSPTSTSASAFEISQVYKNEISRIAPLIIDSFELIDYIQTLVSEEVDSLFDYKALEDFILEAAFLLDTSQILLGFTFTMINVKHLKTSLDELQVDPWKTKIDRLLHYLTINENDFKTKMYQDVFKEVILKNPRFKAYQPVLPQIIMRLEKTRLSIEKLIQ